MVLIQDDDMSGCILDQSKFMKISMETKEERITVVQTGCNQGVYEDISAGWCE